MWLILVLFVVVLLITGPLPRPLAKIFSHLPGLVVGKGQEQMATADEHGKWDLASGQLYLASGNNLAHLA